jgi:hypothetical protein
MPPEPIHSKRGALPKEPTDALPGTERKIRVMMERAARREQLFHPLDGVACWSRSLRADGTENRRCPLVLVGAPLEEPATLEVDGFELEEETAPNPDELFEPHTNGHIVATASNGAAATTFHTVTLVSPNLNGHD